jgi:hypothetical protein
MREEGQAILFVQVNCDFRVALAAKLVASGTKLFPNLVVPVELAVDYGMHIAIHVMEWLLSLRVQVNNSKTIVAKSWLLSITCFKGQ